MLWYIFDEQGFVGHTKIPRDGESHRILVFVISQACINAQDNQIFQLLIKRLRVLMLVSWHWAYADLLALVDVDAGSGGYVLAHGLAHHVVVVIVHRVARLVGDHLVDT